MAAFKAYLVAIIVIHGTAVLAQDAMGKCLPPTGPNDEFSFTFRFKPSAGNTIVEVGFYDSSAAPANTDLIINTPAQCVDTAATNGIYELGFSVDGDTTLPCGITRTGNTYKMTFGVNGTTDLAYTLTCDAGTPGNLNNFPTSLSITNFDTGNMQNTLVHRENPRSVCLLILHADGNRIPSLFARLGEQLKLRAILDKEYSDGPDLWGSSFHIPILEHTGAEVNLQIVTRGVGQLVKISGILPTKTFTIYRRVFRDQETLVSIKDNGDIDGDYIHPNGPSTTAWTTSLRAIKVEIPSTIECGEIAVKVISRQTSNSNAGSFIAIPDDSLGTKYNSYTGGTGATGSLVLIYATQASTTVTLNFNAYTIAGVTINGNAVTATTTVTMAESEVLNMVCGSDCHLITITSDKPIGVISGIENGKIETADTSATDHYVSQLFPVTTYGDSYVLLPGSLFGNSVQYQIVLEDPTTNVNYTKNSGLVPNVNSGVYIDTVTSAEEVSFTSKVLLIMTSNDTIPFTMPYPAHHQWAIRHYVFMVPGETYNIVVVGRIGTVSKIMYRDFYEITDAGTKTTLGAIAAFSTTNVLPLSGGTARYEFFTKAVSVKSGQGPVMIELVSGVRNSPFMLIVQPTISSNKNIQYMSIGLRLPTVNPCVPSPSTVRAFGTYINSMPGDGIDNDCDGLVDEEINNNQDTDGTGQLDEDLAFNPIYPNLGIFVETLYASNNAQFSTAGTGMVITLIDNGCSQRPAGSAIQVDPFSWNPDIGPMYDTLHVVETKSFGAFFIYEPTVYFRAKINFCGGAELSTSRCNMSCVTSPGRKRRQAGDAITVDTRITITDAMRENVVVYTPEEPCSMDKRFWTPPVLILLTILIESVVIGGFLLNKSPYKRHS